MISLIYGMLKNGTNELIFITDRVTDVENRHDYQWGKVREG